MLEEYPDEFFNDLDDEHILEHHVINGDEQLRSVNNMLSDFFVKWEGDDA